MVLRNPGNQHMSLVAGIAQEPMSMTSRLVAEVYCVSLSQNTAPSRTVMLSSVVGRAIEPTCSAVVHKAQTAVAAISGQRRARWHAFSQRRVRDARVRPNLFQPYLIAPHHPTAESEKSEMGGRYFVPKNIETRGIRLLTTSQHDIRVRIEKSSIVATASLFLAERSLVGVCWTRRRRWSPLSRLSP